MRKWWGGCVRMRCGPGEIVTADGRVVGGHDGIARYTVGQGKRLGDAAVLDGQRQVVVATDPGRRRVVVGPRDRGTRQVPLREVNWLAEAGESVRCAVKLRAHDQMRPATLDLTGGTTVELDEPALPAPARPVFYQGIGCWAVALSHGRRRPPAAALDLSGVACRSCLSGRVRCRASRNAMAHRRCGLRQSKL